MSDKKILVTGTAGFIGFHLCQLLAKSGYQIIGIDSVNSYYSVDLKKARLAILEKIENVRFIQMNLCEKSSIDHLFKEEKFDIVINLAAQAGVRYSIDHPYEYIESNIVGFMNILEACRNNPVQHLIYASSSSVYGNTKEIPFSVENKTDEPVSLYAATKKSNELMAHSYAALYGIPCTGLRFFTVYGPWGRPDMAYFSFSNKITKGQTIQVYNNGDLERDFTYIDDITAAIERLIDVPFETEKEKQVPARVFNIGNNQPVRLMEFIETLERHLGTEALKEFLPMQKGDVYRTYADITDLEKRINFKPHTSLDEGLGKFVEWYKGYYKV